MEVLTFPQTFESIDNNMVLFDMINQNSMIWN